MREALIFIVALAFKLVILTFCFGIFGQLLLYNQFLAFAFAGLILLLIAAS